MGPKRECWWRRKVAALKNSFKDMWGKRHLLVKGTEKGVFTETGGKVVRNKKESMLKNVQWNWSSEGLEGTLGLYSQTLAAIALCQWHSHTFSKQSSSFCFLEIHPTPSFLFLEKCQCHLPQHTCGRYPSHSLFYSQVGCCSSLSFDKYFY